MSSAEENKQVIQAFYESFKQADGESMAALYHPEAVFSDPVFPKLNAEQAGAMWRMFCRPGSDLKVEFSGVEASDTSGRARWEARYSFPGTGRTVHNVISSSFEFKDGQIVRHTDDFDFYKWARMALGPVGLLLGWTPFVRNKIRKQAASQLRRSMGSS